MNDRAFRDVQCRYDDWASAEDDDTRDYALRLMEEALDEYEERNALLHGALAKAAHDYARLLARTSHTRRGRAPWRDSPLACVATVWGALVGEDRHDLTGFLAVVFGIIAIVAALLVVPPVLR